MDLNLQNNYLPDLKILSQDGFKSHLNQMTEVNF